MESNNWSRDHDRILAERCEGMRFIERGFAGGPLLPEPPRYDTDIAACFRAAEAWRKRNPSERKWAIDSPWGVLDNFEAGAREGWNEKRWTAAGATPADAIAWALYEAVKDV